MTSRRNPSSRAAEEIEAYLRTQGVRLDAAKIQALADAVAQDFVGSDDPDETMRRLFATWEADALMYGPSGSGNAVYFARLDAQAMHGQAVSKAIAGRLVSVYVPVSQGHRYLDMMGKITQILDSTPGPAKSAAPPPEDLALINRVRRRIGMPALDPSAVGWSDDDVHLEAERLRREGNPRAACLSWSSP